MDKKTLAIITLLSLPISYVVRGVVLSTMWCWFLVPLGLTEIGKAHAIGIASLVSLIACSPPQCRDDRDNMEKIGAYFGIAFIVPFIVLLAGFIVKQFM